MISKKIKSGLAGLCLFAALSTAGCGQREQKPLLEGAVDGSYYKFFKQGHFCGKRIEVKKSDGTVLKYYDQGGDSSRSRTVEPYYVFNKSGYVETNWNQGYIDRIEIITPDGEKKVFKNSLLMRDPYDPLMVEATEESIKAVKILAGRTRQEYEKARQEYEKDIEKYKKMISGEIK